MARNAVATVPDTLPAIVAAAANIALDGTSWKTFKLGTTQWQTEAWRHYDICAEMRFAAGALASAISRSRIYIAELDELGRPGEEVEDEDVAVLAETVFGGPANKAEAQRLLGLQLFVAGESYIVAEEVASSAKDIWYVASNAEVRRQGDKIVVERSNVHGGGRRELKQGKDLLIRCWTPHPRKYDAADSSVRAVLPTLREIEQLTKKVFAQIDSRLAGAGILFLPAEVDFPRKPKDPPGIAGFQAMLERSMSAAMQDQSAASALVPIIVKIAGEYIDKIKWLTFETPFQAETLEYRTAAINRLALGLDLPPEVLLGQGSANHWSAWQIEESTVKLQVEPLLVRIVDALTEAYLKPALKVIGKDPDAYTFWYDTSPLTVRPDRQADALALNGGPVPILSAEAMRTAGNWSEDDAATEEDVARSLAAQLVLVQPALIANPDIQKALGVSWEIEQAQPGQPAEPGMVEPRAVDEPPMRGLPEMPTSTETPAQEAALLVGGDLLVRRALERAGHRMLTRARRTSGQFASIPAERLHTQIVVPLDEAERLMDGAFASAGDLARRVGMNADVVEAMLATYAVNLVTHSEPHDYAKFAIYVHAALDLVGHGQCNGRCVNPLHPGECAAGEFHGDHDQKDHGRPGPNKPDLPSGDKPDKADDLPKRKDRSGPPKDRGKERITRVKRDELRAAAQASGQVPDEMVRARPLLGHSPRDLRKWGPVIRFRASQINAPYRQIDDDGNLIEPGELPPLRGDSTMAAVADQQGFSGLPTVATDAELDAEIERGGIEIWRGVKRSYLAPKKGGESPEAQIEQLRSGPAYYGAGVYGSGIYGGDEKRITEQYAGGTRFAGPEEQAKGPLVDGGVVRMVLRPEARVIEYSEAIQAYSDWFDAMSDAQIGLSRTEANDIRTEIATFNNLGTWAAAQGWDAIVANEAQYAGSEGDRSDHYAVLNRTALLVSDQHELFEARTPEPDEDDDDES